MEGSHPAKLLLVAGAAGADHLHALPASNPCQPPHDRLSISAGVGRLRCAVLKMAAMVEPGRGCFGMGISLSANGRWRRAGFKARLLPVGIVICIFVLGL